ncbi:MAG: hypothetical protein WB783_19410 [Arenicellales bacterium]
MHIEAWIQPVAVWTTHMRSEFIVVGGVLNAAFAVVHLMHWRLFNWREELRTLTFVNRGVVQILNLCLAFVFCIFAYVSLVHTDELTSSLLGYSLLALIALFWLARAVQQIIFFRLRHWPSRALFLVFLVGASLYGMPAVMMFWPRLAST